MVTLLLRVHITYTWVQFLLAYIGIGDLGVIMITAHTSMGVRWIFHDGVAEKIFSGGQQW